MQPVGLATTRIWTDDYAQKSPQSLLKTTSFLLLSSPPGEEVKCTYSSETLMTSASFQMLLHGMAKGEGAKLWSRERSTWASFVLWTSWLPMCVDRVGSSRREMEPEWRRIWACWMKLRRLHQHVFRARVSVCHTNKSNSILSSNVLDKWHSDREIDNNKILFFNKETLIIRNLCGQFQLHKHLWFFLDMMSNCLICLAFVNHKGCHPYFRIGSSQDAKITIVQMEISPLSLSLSSLFMLEWCLYFKHIVQSHCNMCLIGVHS